MKSKTLIITALAAALIFGSALAQEQVQTKPAKTPRITKKQVHQQARIKQGVKSGALTKPEAVKLEKEQAKIRHDKKVAKSDGKVTPQERQKIRREQRKSSRHIHRLKHNDVTNK
jgi:tellurite resistance protein